MLRFCGHFIFGVTEVKEQHLGMNVKGNSYTVLDRNLGATSVIHWRTFLYRITLSMGAEKIRL